VGRRETGNQFFRETPYSLVPLSTCFHGQPPGSGRRRLPSFCSSLLMKVSAGSYPQISQISQISQKRRQNLPPYLRNLRNLWIIPSVLRAVVRDAGRHDSCKSCHGHEISR